MKTKPTRRMMGLLLSIAMMVALIPALPAFAAPPATAELTAGAVGFPSPDAPRSFAIKVTNNADGNALSGERINFVSITLPAGKAGVVLGDSNGTPPEGWSVEAIKVGSLQVLEYRPSSLLNSGIAPGATTQFSFPALVKRPLNSELTGSFRVDVSSNGGTDLGAASGNLATTVKILETLTGANDGLRPTAPTGVTDRTATAGQTITYGYTVRNHAVEGVSVDGVLSVANDPAGTTTIGDATATRIVPGALGTASFSHSLVELGSAETDRTVAFKAAVAKTGGGATATDQTDNLTVWVPSTLDVTGISPIRTRATRTQDGTTIQAFNSFTVDGKLTGTPQLELDGGSLAFADTAIALDSANSSSDTLNFGPAEITGADGSHKTTVTLTGEDENGFAYSQTIAGRDAVGDEILDLDLLDIIIDTLAPDVTVDVTLPGTQSAVKDGDTVEVSGTIGGVDVDLSTLQVFLDPDVGENIEVSDVSTTGSDSDGDGTNDTWDFSGSVSPTWHADAKTFVATANVLDTAENAGTGSSLGETVDNIIPTLTNPGRTGTTTGGESFIRVVFDDAYAGDLRGGCDAELYGIDGVPNTVKEVRFAEDANTACEGAASNGSGVRYLILRDSLDPTETPKVSYLFSSPDQARLLGSVPTHDGAINDVGRTVIDTVAGIVPAPPEIVAITRNGGSETAVEDGGTVFTRFGNEDLEVEFTIPGSGYTIQVVERDEDGTIRMIKEQSVAGPDRTNLEGNGSDFITIPLPELSGCDADGKHCTSDGVHERGLRFVAGGPTGEIEWLDIAIDTVPLSFTAAFSGNVATVTFNEIVWDGTDAARDWFGFENIVVEGQAERDYYRAHLVESPNKTSRTLTFADDAVLDGIEYLRSSQSSPYVDRAGNEQPDTLTP